MSDAQQATVSRLPYRNGDGYSYGGEVVVTIGKQSFLLDAGAAAEELASEIVRRWNSTRPLPAKEEGK